MKRKTKERKATPTGHRYHAPALEKGMDILKVLAEEPHALTLQAISERLSRSRGELFRMIQVLQARGYVEQIPGSGGYSLTDLLFSMAMHQPKVQSLLEIALPVMRQLSIEIGQSCHLGVHSRGDMVVVGRMESQEQIGFSVRIGYRKPMTQTASGCVLYAFQPDDIRARWGAMLDPAIPAKEKKSFFERVALVRERGWERVTSTYVPSVTDISAPLLRHDRAVAALTVPYLKTNQPLASVTDALRVTRDAAAQISSKLAHADNRV